MFSHQAHCMFPTISLHRLHFRSNSISTGNSTPHKVDHICMLLLQCYTVQYKLSSYNVKSTIYDHQYVTFASLSFFSFFSYSQIPSPIFCSRNTFILWSAFTVRGVAHSYRINTIKASYIWVTVTDGIWENTWFWTKQWQAFPKFNQFLNLSWYNF